MKNILNRLKRIWPKIEVLIITIFFISISFYPIKINAQEIGPSSPEHDKGWFSAGLGIDAPLDLSGSIIANFGRKHFWQFGLQVSEEFMLSGRGTNVTSFNIGRGISFVKNWGRFSIAGGPAVIWGLDRYDSDLDTRKSYISGGLLLNSQFIVTPIKELGVGFELYCNVNPVIIVGGIRAIFVLEGNK